MSQQRLLLFVLELWKCSVDDYKVRNTIILTCRQCRPRTPTQLSFLHFSLLLHCLLRLLRTAVVGKDEWMTTVTCYSMPNIVGWCVYSTRATHQADRPGNHGGRATHWSWSCHRGDVSAYHTTQTTCMYRVTVYSERVTVACAWCVADTCAWLCEVCKSCRARPSQVPCLACFVKIPSHVTSSCLSFDLLRDTSHFISLYICVAWKYTATSAVSSKVTVTAKWRVVLSWPITSTCYLTVCYVMCHQLCFLTLYHVTFHTEWPSH